MSKKKKDRKTEIIKNWKNEEFGKDIRGERIMKETIKNMKDKFKNKKKAKKVNGL